MSAENCGMSEKDIEYWINYAGHKDFASAQAARDWVFWCKQKFDEQYGDTVGVSGEAKNRADADSLPVYQNGKSFKIGKPTQRPKKQDIPAPLAEEVNFSYSLGKGMKGVLINGDWSCWPVGENGSPHHDEVLEKRFEYQEDDGVRATHWFDGSLSIQSSYGLFDPHTKSAVDAFRGNRGTGSKIVIDSPEGNWEGDFRTYERECVNQDEEVENEVVAWVMRNCRFASIVQQ